MFLDLTVGGFLRLRNDLHRNTRCKTAPGEAATDFCNNRVKIEDLDITTAQMELRAAIQEIFHESRDKRAKQSDFDIDPISLNRLVAHDVENYLGVIMRRKEEKSSALGYSAWWLTLHKTALIAEPRLRSRLGRSAPASPVLSPDFLANYIAFGPRRGRLSKSTEARLPVSLGLEAVEYMPIELLKLAEAVRSEMSGLPEHLVRRRVRDAIDAAKARQGTLSSEGLPAIEEEIIKEIRAPKN